MGIFENIKYKIDRNKEVQHNRILQRKKDKLRDLEKETLRKKEIAELDKQIKKAEDDISKSMRL